MIEETEEKYFKAEKVKIFCYFQTIWIKLIIFRSISKELDSDYFYLVKFNRRYTRKILKALRTNKIKIFINGCNDFIKNLNSTIDINKIPNQFKSLEILLIKVLFQDFYTIRSLIENLSYHINKIRLKEKSKLLADYESLRITLSKYKKK